ncbi:aminoglycoside phosphotransferase [Actinorhabdospora filicis]|uniref:Aminoglycoside phosphotransferase n=1 Tax=Actinorhabdospora filicis TaxID=1785913 RepID=A0A9W6WC10_9ACTN|nr:aminoglycoside phosphotransferase family protein [Actinorhabdospora filicis]GLZ80121.1 aminoglycoside phosphotransferase [Actinorhabdospora filicis]
MNEITTELAARLVAAQFPQWAHLPVTSVDRQGHDNRTFRLGGELSVRLPTDEGYVAAVSKEDTWLPHIARHLPVAVPEPVAVGVPGPDYPFPWAVRRWLPGADLLGADTDDVAIAGQLGDLLTALRAVPAEGPAAGEHSFFRGCHPTAYADQVQRSLEILGDTVDAEACRAVWSAGVTTVWTAPPVWFHGDIAYGNLLAENGRLSALIDFGTSGVGDPACDLAIAWGRFTGEARKVFRERAGLDDDTWRRARAWAVWKALVVLAGMSGPDDTQRRVLTEALADSLV